MIPAIPLALWLMTAGFPAAAREGGFVSWARAHLAPIDASDGAFRALDQEVDGARLIGMGESVHETEPFLSFRVRFMKDLVQRHRVTALVFESGLAEAMELDAYVLGRTTAIDYPRALPGGFADLLEIRNAMEWIRDWNLGPGRDRPVHIYGADVPGRQASMLPGLDRLQELTSDQPRIRILIDAVRPVATLTAAPWWRAAGEKYAALPQDEKTTWTRSVKRLVEAVDQADGGDEERVEWARRVALVVGQYEALLRLGGFSAEAPRERAMADNIMWILARLGRGEKAVYWAHNAHIQRAPVTGPPLPPGRFSSAGLLLAEDWPRLPRRRHGVRRAFAGCGCARDSRQRGRGPGRGLGKFVPAVLTRQVRARARRFVAGGGAPHEISGQAPHGAPRESLRRDRVL